MAGLIDARFLTCAVVAGAGFALAACSSTTYGTGVSPGMQTIKDVAGITSLSGEDKEPINYEPRPSVVLPPETAALPPPGDDNTTVAANWPVDPDEQEAQFKAKVASLEAEGETLDFRLPTGATPKPNPTAEMTPAERKAYIKQLAKDAKSVVAVDEFGNPVRRYLSDPPAAYMAGDPDAPVLTAEELKDEKKKKKKWWQIFGGGSQTAQATPVNDHDQTAKDLVY